MEWVKEFKFDPIKPLLSSKTQERDHRVEKKELGGENYNYPGLHGMQAAQLHDNQEQADHAGQA